ncbi:MAG: LacI family DNA-binding transcriptional regulator [Terrimicrobiaceae bacterium]
MDEKKSSRVSVGDIARAAGVSKTSVAFALQNRPGVSEATRERIKKIARKLGYAPDARMDAWMARLRDAKSKDLLPIAWLNTHVEEDVWRKYNYLSPYLEGARARCLELGYRLEEVWMRRPGLTMQRLSQILYSRGIEGVIVTHPARHLRLKWDHLASVAIGGALLTPQIHRVMTDISSNLLLAWKWVKRAGYRRIGICLSLETDRFSEHALRSTAHYLISTTTASNRVEPLFYTDIPKGTTEAPPELIRWLHSQKPDAIIGHNRLLVQWVEGAGYRVPDEIGVVHLAVDDDVPDWTGIHSDKRGVAAAAAEWLISLIRNHRFGVPAKALNMMIRGSWQHGRTLLVPKPK